MAKEKKTTHEIIILPINSLQINDINPRDIKSEQYEKLKTSISEFPEMLNIRPIIINDKNIVLGGNMRLRACMELGLKEVPTINVGAMSEEKQKEFIIKDNVSFGNWDYDSLANGNWNKEELELWGVHLFEGSGNVNMDEFFNTPADGVKEEKFKITLEYNEEDYALILKVFKGFTESKEQVIFKLLTE